MRRLLLVLLALALTLVLVLIPARAEADPGCVITVAGVKVCGELLGEPLPEVIEVTVTPDPIIIPGPTSTQTVTPPPVTMTVPGPTTTVTETPQPETVTVTPDAVPSESVSPSETGQPTPQDDTIGTNDESDRYTIDFGDGDTTLPEVGIGILTLLALVGLILLALYSGYVLGYKDKERKETRFMRALLDSVKSR